MDGSCDVPRCTNETYLGWRPLTEPKGKQVCEYHFRWHDDPAESFNLWDAFHFRRPAKIKKPTTKKYVPRCACGRERLPGRRFCAACAVPRERAHEAGLP